MPLPFLGEGKLWARVECSSVKCVLFFSHQVCALYVVYDDAGNADGTSTTSSLNVLVTDVGSVV